MGPADQPQAAYVFPGQASQAVGMGRDLFDRSQAARRVFETADRVLDRPLSALCFDGPAEALRPTEVQQLAVVVTSLASYAAFVEVLGVPDWPLRGHVHPVRLVALAGHSVGLCTACIASGAMDLAEGLALVHDRGRFMAAAAAARPGTMAAVIGLDVDAVEPLVVQVRDKVAGSYLSVANINAPGQVVVAGDLGGIDALHDIAQSAGARRVIPLDVSGAFHTVAMLPAQAAMRERALAVGLQDPPVPILSNVDATPMTTSAAVRAELADHVAAPVQWLRGVRELERRAVTDIVEFGHGNVLTGMLRRTVTDIALHNVSDAASAARAAEALTCV